MSDGRLNSADTSRPSARHAVALGLVLLVGVTVAGAALGGVTAAESQSSPVKISNWTDLQAIDDSQATLSDDYVLVNDLNKSTAGYNAVVLNQTATEFTEEVSFDFGESRVNLTRTPVAELLSNDKGFNLTVVDSANGTIKRQDTSPGRDVNVSYTTPTERFVGFNPVGSLSSERFTGRFDGRGNTIRDLLIDRPTDYGVGLFGVSEGTLEQVTVANASITGSADVGGLVGGNFGTVSNSSASGAVNSSGRVGGLVGGNGGTVSNSSASGAVNGSADVGGLVGGNFGTVSNSSASGAVDGSERVGGLVAFNQGTVSNSSASGAVNGSERVGGLVGLNLKFANNEGIVSESFATGAVTGSSDVGGLVGYNPGTVTGSYWDIQATGQSGSAGGTGLNTSQMQGASAAQNMVALDFTNTWQIVTDPAGYPELQAGPPPAAEIGPDIEDTDSDGDGGDGENGDTDGDGSDAGDDGGSDDGGSDDDGDGGNGDGGNGGNGDGGNGGDGFGPGFGPGVVLAGLSGAGYLLKRRGTTTDTDAE